MKDLDTSVISNSQLNNSSSKMKYSFPKSDRFDRHRYESPSPPKFYDLPEIKSKRSAGIGYGNKMDLSKRNFIVPAPNSYKMNSSFQLKKNQGITIAEGRDKISAGDMFKTNFKVPSPFDYNPEKPHKSLSYSLSYRMPDNSDKWIKMVPGPGNYSAIEITNKETKIPVSKYISAPSTRFGHNKRLSQTQLRNNRNPGPAEYNNQTTISKHFSHKGGSKFPNSQREGMAKKFLTPGPGNQYLLSNLAIAHRTSIEKFVIVDQQSNINQQIEQSLLRIAS